jgi:hypothetical protein
MKIAIAFLIAACMLVGVGIAIAGLVTNVLFKKRRHDWDRHRAPLSSQRLGRND